MLLFLFLLSVFIASPLSLTKYRFQLGFAEGIKNPFSIKQETFEGHAIVKLTIDGKSDKFTNVQFLRTTPDVLCILANNRRGELALFILNSITKKEEVITFHMIWIYLTKDISEIGKMMLYDRCNKERLFNIQPSDEKHSQNDRFCFFDNIPSKNFTFEDIARFFQEASERLVFLCFSKYYYFQSYNDISYIDL
jgi:hypothetical protein